MGDSSVLPDVHGFHDRSLGNSTTVHRSVLHRVSSGPMVQGPLVRLRCWALAAPTASSQGRPRIFQHGGSLPWHREKCPEKLLTEVASCSHPQHRIFLLWGCALLGFGCLPSRPLTLSHILTHTLTLPQVLPTAIFFHNECTLCLLIGSSNLVTFTIIIDM
uniref:Uncharacterized protein n=1 Tax=Molossus molossus TaxID=27622 RepID=A0A7J8HDN5_MOLMO|nr:hypothetical protein HJG59_011150 [Molossus molossus]